jgi:hypothetical protein
MGCKLHLLIGSYARDERAGNILISFNNYSSSEAIPLVGQLNLGSAVEFTPTPQQTNQIIQERYEVADNLLIRFSNDTIDQTPGLRQLLSQQFPQSISYRQLAGNHLTPLGQELNLQPSQFFPNNLFPTSQEFSPLDAVGQWMGQWVRQELLRELGQLEDVILGWLG